MDRPDDFDVPSSPDEGVPDRASAGRRVAVEERDRFEYYDALRSAARGDAPSVSGRVSAETPDAIARDVSAETRSGSAPWDEASDQFRCRWAEHLERWPAGERAQADRSQDPEGSWRGDSGRFLDSAANAEVEARYERIATTEREILTPAMREIEACDPERHLVGLEHRLKGLERLKDKVAETVAEQPGLSAQEALADVSDAIRFTFRYQDLRYTSGVSDDLGRLENHGFELVKLKNFWAQELYKGINTQWLIPETGQRFEVQFHTELSYEAKQLTHGAYERLRVRCADDQEEDELESIQRGVSSCIPRPPECDEIRNYPERRNVGLDNLLRYRHSSRQS